MIAHEPRQQEERYGDYLGRASVVKRTVLLLTTDYPPLAGTNTRRVEAFARHLPAYGWQPVVLTLALEDMQRIESSWPGDVSVETIRVKSPGVQSLTRRLRGQRPLPTGAAETPEGVKGSSSRASRSHGVGWRGLLAPLWTWVVRAERLCYVPDPRRLWAAAAVHAALRFAAKRCIDAVVTSAPPFSSHLAGLALRRRLGVPWVADFRDLWVGRPFRQLPYAWQHRLDRRYEARVVTGADRLLLASPGWLPDFRRRYGRSISDKTTVITNGFDSAFTQALGESAREPATAGRPVRIVYTGALHAGESPRPVFEALLQLAQRIGRERVRAGLFVRLIGPGASDWHQLTDKLHQAGLDGVVEFAGTLSHAECLREQLAADVLLILSAPPHDQTIRGKSFEYMATGKPILALVPDGSVQAEILAPSGLATVVSYNDVATMTNVLERLLSSGVPPVVPEWSYINRFERRQLTRALADVLDGCADVRRSISEVRA